MIGERNTPCASLRTWKEKAIWKTGERRRGRALKAEGGQEVSVAQPPETCRRPKAISRRIDVISPFGEATSDQRHFVGRRGPVPRGQNNGYAF